MSYAGEDYWDRYFDDLREAGCDLDWAASGLARSSRCFSLPESSGFSTSAAGLDTTPLAWRRPVSASWASLLPRAIAQARERYGTVAEFVVVDMAERLPFGDGAFDAVMANVALHMFPDATTRSIFTEAGRVLGSWGLFLFHVNTHDDRPLRARRREVAREIEPGYVLERGGRRCASSRASISRAPARMGVGRARSHRAARPRNAPAVQARLAGRCPPSRLSRGNRRGTL